ncbi:hypothetical protein [Haliscomenobacter hydrossis]|uniref:Uncharacterized protein n=1 Tax=Haliscomenobacter hydrossis (strain ATCC 27775 / DSM 1100 / LMG 10767 / O) TaxID=760192 RepID=F4L4C2_HALH1|nr:hypothetical protein [Haliscomenobacter hydrossis]AEE51791.1 hypothetical protein Halhy_3943 [Haliscomenobacter hydrossis DSM 1100]
MARKKEDFLCMVDANSYFYMRITELNNSKTLWDYLADSQKVCFSNIVNSELNRNDKKFVAYYQITQSEVIKRHSKHAYNFKKNQTKLTLALFDEIIKVGDKDGGEKANWAAAIDTFFQRKQLAYISDEDRAIGNSLKKRDGFLKDQIATFPFFPIWNTFDTILYLYARQILTFDLAEDAIRGLDGFFLKLEKGTLETQKRDGTLSKDQFSRSIRDSFDRSNTRKIAYIERLQLIQKSLSV